MIVAGRIIPNFTAGWLRQNGRAPLRPSPRWLDHLALALTVASFAAGMIPVPPVWASPAFAALALGAAAAHAARMSGWRSKETAREPILWVLHLGYAWLVIGFLCRAASLLTSVLPETAALHAFTVGVVGTLALGVMSRASLGHTGRPLTLAPAIPWAYGLVSLAALVRILGPTLFPQTSGALLLLSGGLWTLAFLLFVAVYLPILTRPRGDGGEG